MNPYQILEIPQNADLATIKRAYKKLAMVYHPDKNKSPDALSKMQEINKAYTILCKSQPNPIEQPVYSQPNVVIIRYHYGNSNGFGTWSYSTSGTTTW